MSTAKIFTSDNRIMEQTPLSNPGVYNSSIKQSQFISEEQLVQKLKKLMKMNLKNLCY